MFEKVRVSDLSFYYDGVRINAVNWLHAIVFAIVIEAAILMFILHGKRLASNIYAVASFAINMLYYAPWDADIPQIVTTTLISAMLSGSIWFFSDLFAEKVMNDREDMSQTILSELAPGSHKMNFKTTFPENR
ncbi:MAG: hypothetical protein WBA23_22275 [Tunicatimonas sp.]|uniref:hypothetical protein n=1 Tax=Tunicatimonas sp. TaxID=1940096 RepID=UPI003C71A656